MPNAMRNDQAEGLRQMFANASARFVPVVSNPHIAFGGVMLERLCTAFAERGQRVLVIDAAERAGEAGEMALVELGQCIETLSPQVSYLAARGLPIRFVDATGSTRGFLERVAEAAPGRDLVLVHAAPSELCRMFSRRHRIDRGEAHSPHPIVLADDNPASVTHAYAAMKLLAGRAGIVVFDLLLGAAPHSPRADRIAAKLASCADSFFGAVLRGWARIDPAGDAGDAPSDALRRLITSCLDGDASSPHSHRAFGHHAGFATP
jgi:flagellar biosynthesis protein FlhG